MFFEPCIPAGHEGWAGALTTEDAVEVAAMDTELCCGDGGAGILGIAALVRCGNHKGC